ncbi:Cyclin-L1 [Blomia tropicalis]|nr:Cyclin-L1 [Blomia tropicalis]
MAKYGHVVVSVENPILPNEIIENTPSSLDGLDQETEHDLRITGCKLIQTSGILLRLSQVTTLTGQVLFQRYYYSNSFVRFPMEYTAMACVVLASKLEETSRHIRHVINVFHNMKQIRLGQTPVPVILNRSFSNQKKQVIKAESRILKELGFCVNVEHPQKYIIMVAEVLGHSQNAPLIQAAWGYMNDSLHSNVYVRFPPETIACACIHLSARVLKVPLPTSPPWYMVFRVDTETIDKVCTTILELYTRVPLSQEELEEKVEMAKKVLEIGTKSETESETESSNLTSSEWTENSTETTTLDSSINSPVKDSDTVLDDVSVSLAESK